jgi:hypothetical protein
MLRQAVLVVALSVSAAEGRQQTEKPVRAPSAPAGMGVLTVASPRVNPVVFPLRAAGRLVAPPRAVQTDDEPVDEGPADEEPIPEWEAGLTGLWLGDDLVLTPLPASVRIDEPFTLEQTTRDGGWVSVPVIALDRTRRLAIVRVDFPPLPPTSPHPRRPPGVSVAPEAPGTVYVVEDRPGLETGWVVDNENPSPLAVPGWPGTGIALPNGLKTRPGAIVFDLEGTFAGVTLEAGDKIAILPARHVLDAVRTMRGAAAEPGTLPLKD